MRTPDTEGFDKELFKFLKSHSDDIDNGSEAGLEGWAIIASALTFAANQIIRAHTADGNELEAVHFAFTKMLDVFQREPMDKYQALVDVLNLPEREDAPKSVLEKLCIAADEMREND